MTDARFRYIEESGFLNFPTEIMVELRRVRQQNADLIDANSKISRQLADHAELVEGTLQRAKGAEARVIVLEDALRVCVGAGRGGFLCQAG